MKKVALILTCVFLSCAVAVGAAAEKKKKVKYVKSKYGVRALIRLGKSMGDMAEELKQDTKNYRKVTKAIDRETIKKGESASKVEKTYGEPVIVLANEKENVTKWIYKPGNVTFFEDKKVYLIFDEDNKLADWITMDGKGQ
jgi:hypothetical protein